MPVFPYIPKIKAQIVTSTRLGGTILTRSSRANETKTPPFLGVFNFGLNPERVAGENIDFF